MRETVDGRFFGEKFQKIGEKLSAENRGLRDRMEKTEVEMCLKRKKAAAE